MNLSRTTISAAALLAAVAAGCESNKKASEPAPAPAQAPAPAPAAAAPERPLTVSDSVQVVLTARVKAINHASRFVTLEDSSGHTISFVAAPEIQRLNEVAVGDSVRVEYVASLLAELRPATAAESSNALVSTAVAGRAGPGSAPAAGAAEVTTIVTTVVGIDQTNMRVTLKGPLGDTTTVRARSAENIRKLRVGDTIVITYTEAVAVSLVKAN